jgi:autotransporter-associated beta strand protein
MKNHITSTAALALLGAILLPAPAPANIAESLQAADANGTSSLTGTTNWTPSTSVAPTSSLAPTYDYTAAFTLRTPTGTANYTVLADSLTIASGGSLAFKGQGTNTFNNLILNGGGINQSGTGVPTGNPDLAWLAGNINLASNTTITPSTSTGTNQFLTILATITNAANANLTVSGSGSAHGSGTLVLAAQNTFTGPITVLNETPGVILKLGINNALPVGTTLTLNAGTNSSPVFDMGGYSTTISNLTFTGYTGGTTGIVTNSAPGTTSTLTLGYNNATQSLAYGLITDNPSTAGTVALTKIGTGTLTLDITNTYSGDTTVSAGTLKMGASNLLPNGAGKGNLIVNGTLDIAGRAETINGLSGSGTIDNSGGTAGESYVLTVGNNNASGTFSGTIQNTLNPTNQAYVALTKMGTGTLYLTGTNNNFNGDVVINTGAVWIASSSALGVTVKDIIIEKFTTTSELHLNGTNGNISLPSALYFYTGNDYGEGAIVNEAGSNTINGTLSLSTGGATLVTVNGGSLGLEGNIAIAGLVTSRPLTLGGAGNGTVDGMISDGNSGILSLIVNGPGAWTLTSANTYSGSTTINAGTLALGAYGSIAGSAITVLGGATLDVAAVAGGWTLGAGQTLNGYGTVVGNVTANGTVATGVAIGTLTFSNSLTLAGTSLMTINRVNTPANADMFSAAALTFGGTLTVTNSGAALQAGDSFHLFSGSLSGAFAVTNLPALSSSNLVWDTSLLGSQGIIKVASTSAAPRPTFQPMTVSGTNLNLQFSSSAGFNYYLESATNIGAPVWIPISTNSGGGTIQLQVPINPATPKVFFRLSVGSP